MVEERSPIPRAGCRVWRERVMGVTRGLLLWGHGRCLWLLILGHLTTELSGCP